MKILILADRRLRTDIDNSTLKLTEAFMQGMYIATKAKKDEDLNIDRECIEPCKGCNACWQSSSGKCDNIKGMRNIYQKFHDADLIIWSFPLYYYGSPSIMKAFVGIKSKPDQKHVIISAGTFSTTKGEYEAIVKQFRDLYKDKFISILCPQGEVFAIPKLSEKTTKYLALVRTGAAQYLMKGIISPNIEKQLTIPLFSKEEYEKMKRSYG
ncbi:MAG: NAD(P)H-dependent oxidoreductase [Treponema sp.]|nr:NAD(P)H-dependent oxidoreductase [Treponema sp.]